MRSEKKVLFISYDGLSDPVGQSQIIPYFEKLSAEGFEITILSFEKPEKLSAEVDKIKLRLLEASIHWVSFYYTKNPPVLSTLFDFRKMRREACRICNREKIGLIHARSYLPAMAALYLKKKQSIPFIFDMRGFWADERIDGNIWSMKNPVFKTIYRFFKRKEKKLLRYADAIVSLTRNASDFMIKNWSVINEKIVVIPCAADYLHFDPSRVSDEQKKNIRANLKIPETANVLFYHGSIGTWYLAEPMFDFFRQMCEKIPDSYFLWCTNENPDKLRILAENKGIAERVVLKSQVSRNEMPFFLSLANYCIMFIKPSFSKIASSPIKYAESLAMNKPVICNAGVGDLIDNELNNYGVLVNNLTSGEFEMALEKLTKINYPSMNIRENSKAEFDLEINTGKYLNLYNKFFKKI